MELYQLEYFLEAARQRNFTRAAEQLHLAQAALSEQMRKLERELGTPLFHRAKRETTLTAAGELLRSHAESLLTQAARAKQAVQDLVTLRGGRLSIGAIPSVSAMLLPEAIAAFRREHPQVELALAEDTSRQVAQWVESGRVELGIVQLPTQGGSFHETLLFRERFVVLAPQSHPLANLRRVRLTDLAQEGFVVFKGRVRDTVHTACRAAGFEPRTVCESGELETIRSLVAAGLGIAILPELATHALPAGCTRLRLTAPSVTRRVALLQRKQHALSPAALAFRNLLRGLPLVQNPARKSPPAG
ncbi:LysR family transcriptional regulator [Tuwongella immobilis]|uniref:HTH lysR-type domain-containing protein n=1 Tax=Tuwongella immobilis TaxID=692036 RepID=A0A6C2YY22_9BACT|nr:LysR family transcriptional regulator [Tuwongella immobilis]VIP05645.1 family transcriptional regulator : Transcriptional regulator, LysR family OS=Chthoniobacter flavus Ellin428 GN=CfE428DRAFT_6616 PE=4 SV=1: HTH_1: LysR_substrate [Tuwongella immobilis]VTS08646.1 family transcriptional regulator : Transcriptional regulator, LysR family OS=Chthoniobacter flavus Ellin428 GN=CfE428DRAFT_6616 PE=4 SV=1: HTH_1: LysR_substrate [Tuwongella immobilis]